MPLIDSIRIRSRAIRRRRNNSRILIIRIRCGDNRNENLDDFKHIFPRHLLRQTRSRVFSSSRLAAAARMLDGAFCVRKSENIGTRQEAKAISLMFAVAQCVFVSPEQRRNHLHGIFFLFSLLFTISAPLRPSPCRPLRRAVAHERYLKNGYSLARQFAVRGDGGARHTCIAPSVCFLWSIISSVG